MSLSGARRRADAAQTALLEDQARSAAASARLMRHVRRLGAPLLIGGGLVTGILLARLPLQRLARLASAAPGIAVMLLRSPLGKFAVASALRTKPAQGQQAPATPRPRRGPSP